MPYRTDDYETFRIRPLVPKGRFIYRTREDRAAWTGHNRVAAEQKSNTNRSGEAAEFMS